MKELIKLHWRFLRQPTLCLDQFVSVWPVKYGIGIYLLFACGMVITNGNALQLWGDILPSVFGFRHPIFPYLWIAGSSAFSLLVQYYIMPAIVVRLSPNGPALFQKDLYRRVVFFSPTSYVIFMVVFELPLKFLASIASFNGWETIVIALGLVLAISFAWLIPLSVNMLVMNWVGLRRFFDLKVFQVVLVMFVIPIIIAMPLIFPTLAPILKYLKAYFQ